MPPLERHWRQCPASYLRWSHLRFQSFRPLPWCRPCYSSPLHPLPLPSSRHRHWSLSNSMSHRLWYHRSRSHSSWNRRLASARSDPARFPNRRKEGWPMRTNLRSLGTTCFASYRVSWERGRWPARHLRPEDWSDLRTGAHRLDFWLLVAGVQSLEGRAKVTG